MYLCCSDYLIPPYISGDAQIMSVNNVLEKLEELQEANQQLELCRKDRKELTKDVKNAEERLEQKQQELEDLKKKQTEARRRADDCEAKIEKAEGEIERLEVEMNTTKNQSRYDAMAESIRSHEADIQKWEDEELEALNRLDELSEQREGVKEDIQRLENELEETRNRVEDERQRYDEKIEELKQRRKDIRSEVDDEALDAYDRLARGSDEQALAQVKNRLCMGCFTTITKQQENELLRGNELVFCQSCGKILKLTESEVG